MITLAKIAKTSYFAWLLLLVAYDYGGVVTNSRREPEYSNKSKRPGNLKDMHW